MRHHTEVFYLRQPQYHRPPNYVDVVRQNFITFLQPKTTLWQKRYVKLNFYSYLTCPLARDLAEVYPDESPHVITVPAALANSYLKLTLVDDVKLNITKLTYVVSVVGEKIPAQALLTWWEYVVCLPLYKALPLTYPQLIKSRTEVKYHDDAPTIGRANKLVESFNPVLHYNEYAPTYERQT